MGTRADAEVEGRDGTPVGRRAVLGLLGLGTAGVLVGAKVQDKVAEGLAPGGVVVVESDREVELGPDLAGIRVRRYGGTVVTFATLTGARS